MGKNPHFTFENNGGICYLLIGPNKLVVHIIGWVGEVPYFAQADWDPSIKQEFDTMIEAKIGAINIMQEELGVEWHQRAEEFLSHIKMLENRRGHSIITKKHQLHRYPSWRTQMRKKRLTRPRKPSKVSLNRDKETDDGD